MRKPLDTMLVWEGFVQAPRPNISWVFFLETTWILLYKWARTMCLVPITSKYHGTSFFLCTSSLFFWNTFFFVEKNHWAPFEFVFSNAPKKRPPPLSPFRCPRSSMISVPRQDGSQPPSPIPIATLPKAKADGFLGFFVGPLNTPGKQTPPLL